MRGNPAVCGILTIGLNAAGDALAFSESLYGLYRRSSIADALIPDPNAWL